MIKLSIRAAIRMMSEGDVSKLGITAAACAALLVGAAQGQTVPVQTVPSQPAAPVKHERLICHEDNDIGSLIHKTKRCMTAAQWRQVTAENSSEFERHTAMKEGQGSR
jgi:hypothetical protein